MKRFTIVILVLVTALMGASVAGAQEEDTTPEPGRGGGHHLIIETVSEVTGLSVEEIAEQLAEGATLADIIVANGGNVDEVTAQIAAAISERTGNEDTAEIEARISETLSNPLPERQPNDNQSSEGRPGSGRPGGRPPGGRPPGGRPGGQQPNQVPPAGQDA